VQATLHRDGSRQSHHDFRFDQSGQSRVQARVRRTNATPGATAARFVFWYAFPRIFIDLFRDCPTHRLALGTGQTLNLIMAALGVVLLIRSRMRRLGLLAPLPVHAASSVASGDGSSHVGLRIALVGLLFFCLTIPSNWTQDVPAHYATRHGGLRHSLLYPQIDTAPPPRADQGVVTPGKKP
jgi:hypothetical protein